MTFEDSVEVDALHVGDEMIMSVELVDALKHDPSTRQVRVRVCKIVKRGYVYELHLENSRLVWNDHGEIV
jgi:hypothetical protein